MAWEERPVYVNIGITVGFLLVFTLVAELAYVLGANQTIIMISYTLCFFLISAITDGYVYGIVGTLVGVVIYDLIYITPRNSLSLTMGIPITMFIMLAISLAASAVTAQVKNRAKIATEKERRAEILYSITRRLLEAMDIQEVAKCANEFLVDYLNRSVILYILAPGKEGEFYCAPVEGDADEAFFAKEAELRAAMQAFESKMPAGKTGEDGQPSPAESCYNPICYNGEALGVIGISCMNGELIEPEKVFLRMLNTQVALALRMELLSVQEHRAQVEAETEKARSSFLRAISHDLRTPLTSILGASDALLESGDEMGESTSRHLLQDVRSDAQWLLRMIENILSVTRIQSDEKANMRVVKTVEAVEEVIAEAVAAVRKRSPQAVINVVPPGDLLLVSMDVILIMQVLVNLLENALRHAGRKDVHITIGAEKTDDGYARVTVRDDGRGVQEEILPHLFEIHPKENIRGEDASRGLGMGLSICKTIVKAHGGTIQGGNQPEGGAVFVMQLPLQQEDTHGE